MSAPSFTAADTAVLLIDHQMSAVGWIRTIPSDRMAANALALARTARANGIPLFFAPSTGAYVPGPPSAALREDHPGGETARISRQAGVRTVDEEDFASVVGEAGRKKLIIAGVDRDVWIVQVTLTALRLGYEVAVVTDAGGPPSKTGQDFAVRRMGRAGAAITSTARILAELLQPRAGRCGGRILPFVR
ncbi:isochorismatase family protein [Kitasatospora sp. NPDC085464]|uniref:isochorismatase family protein n=1 Tax=Kitasatospora sp. NPDC085464 TaxID=3364063 RepID=UPI0037CC04EE